jgi:hypothetical protein
MLLRRLRNLKHRDLHLPLEATASANATMMARAGRVVVVATAIGVSGPSAVSEPSAVIVTEVIAIEAGVNPTPFRSQPPRPMTNSRRASTKC